MNDDLDELLAKQTRALVRRTSMDVLRDRLCDSMEAIFVRDGGEEELHKFAAVAPPFRLAADDVVDVEAFGAFESWLARRHHQERLGRLMVTMALVEMLAEETEKGKDEAAEFLIAEMRRYPMCEDD